MKIQIIFFFLVLCFASTKSFAGNNDPKQEDKKSAKLKYEFNIFKMYSITTNHELPDSLKHIYPALPPKKDN